MIEPWNDKLISPPPVNTALSNSEIDLKTLKHTLNNVINILSKQSPLHNESAVFSRLLYKFDKKFRNDIGYRNFKKVNCALRRYLLLNLLKDVEQFTSVLPDEEDAPYYLPTKQMLEYVLIRIIAFSKLMVRIVVCSKQSAVFYLDRVKRGESHWMSLMPYAVLSRIWSMAFVLLQHSCSWYQLLYSFLNKFQSKGVNFLPDNYKLPENLGNWLEIKDINNFGRLEWSKKESVNVESLMIKDDTDDFETILEYVNQINEDTTETQDSTLNVTSNMKILKSDISEVVVKQIDQGEAISRDSFARLMNKNPSSINVNLKKDNYFHVLDNVTNKDALKKFIDKEETFRNEGSNRSLTNHLSFMQWQSLKLSLSKLDNLTINNRKLQRKFEKIWQEKCVNIE
ncbi:uncharacterized protein [Epargyreus clarus]|uniref:uncharacterized protein n=1 Tax=Epargyreus clarus TaxID=520877 RepID=UPI003C2CC167